MKVLIIAEQLRRAVPGGIGTYVTGLLGGLTADRPNHDRRTDDGLNREGLNRESLDREGPNALNGDGVDRDPLEIATWASRSIDRGFDPLRAYGPVRVSPLPAPLLDRSWARGALAAPSDYDWCHATSLATPGVRRAGPPLSTFIHDVAFLTHPELYPARGRQWHEAAVHRAIERSTAIIVPSESTATGLADIGVEPSRIDIIEEGADHLPLLPRTGADYFLSVSTIEPRKNLDRLVEAYARIRPHLPEPWPLKIVGPDGWGDVTIPQTDGVELLGRVDDDALAALFAGARCLVYVPLLEGWGLPVVEAMRAGCAVVSSEVPAALEATELVDPFDVDDIARGMLAVATDDALRRDLETRGRDVVAPFTWARCAAGHRIVWNSR
jgi:glycosyltransferase involved in cell wall biosynthesis